MGVDRMIEEYKLANDNRCIEKVEPTREWYEQEIKILHIENEKLKKLVDILLEREMRGK